MQRETDSLTTTTRTLHWIIAIGIIGMISLGLYMESTEAWSLYPIHKSIGALLLVIILARVIWRIAIGWPANISRGSQTEKQLAMLVHWLLILATVAMPISGLLFSIGGGHGLSVFDLEIVAPNIDATTDKTLPLNQGLSDFGQAAHGIIGRIFIAVTVLHIVGALKHHYWDKDDTLRRMISTQ